MRRALILLSAAIILLVAAANIYRDPRVRDLFRSVPGAGSAKRVTVRPATPALPKPPVRAEPVSAPAAAAQNSVPPEEHGGEPVLVNRIPNETVSRVLLQVLAAKGLARGISLEVSDGLIKVIGEVDSDEKQQAIINLIEKGRESRRLDATGLIVRR